MMNSGRGRGHELQLSVGHQQRAAIEARLTLIRIDTMPKIHLIALLSVITLSIQAGETGAAPVAPGRWQDYRPQSCLRCNNHLLAYRSGF